MDSKHRHELEQNDLADFIGHFSQWWKKNGMMLLVSVLVVCAVVFGVRVYNERKAAEHDNAWQELASATSPEVYQALAKEYSDPVVIALANLRGADLYVKEFTTPNQLGRPATTQPSSETRNRNLATASQMYKAVLDRQDIPAPLRLNAMLGLASIAENRSEWKEAETWYNKAASEAGEYSTIKTQAQARLSVLPRLGEPVIYAAEPAPAPSTQSALPLP